MPFTLENVVPWGRSFEEYCAMFALTDAGLQGSILGCGDGPASFNAAAYERGFNVISCDPIYQFTAAQIQARVNQIAPYMRSETEKNQHEFHWTFFKDAAELGAARLMAMERFLLDFVAHPDRYITAELPELPFENHQFSLALCSHFLFLYSQQFSLEFHIASIKELCRVAQEVRIFPLLQLGSTPSPHVEPVAAALRAEGCTVNLVRVPYEFQKGGHTMMQVTKP